MSYVGGHTGQNYSSSARSTVLYYVQVLTSTTTVLLVTHETVARYVYVYLLLEGRYAW